MYLQSIIDATKFEHSGKVSEISIILANNAGYPQWEAQLIKQAALFHDIGKCDIPREILNKTGALTPNELTLIKSHAMFGSVRINRALRILSAASVIAENHHERWDGHGYKGITAENIHPYARLVSVADTFDALVSKRPYKRAWSINKTKDYFLKQSGFQFDANIVSILLGAMDEITALYY